MLRTVDACGYLQGSIATLSQWNGAAWVQLSSQSPPSAQGFISISFVFNTAPGPGRFRISWAGCTKEFVTELPATPVPTPAPTPAPGDGCYIGEDIQINAAAVEIFSL